MKAVLGGVILLFVLGLLMGCGSGQALKLGDCPLTVMVKADDDDFDGYANVYIDGKFIGTTDDKTRQLRVSLKPGEYTIIVLAEGYEPWKSKILLLGKGYRQSALASLKKKGEQESVE